MSLYILIDMHGRRVSIFRKKRLRGTSTPAATTVVKYQNTWWRHQMETFSALLALCEGISPVTGEFPSQRPVTRSFDVFFDLRMNKRLSKQPRGRGFDTPSRPLWRHCNGLSTRNECGDALGRKVKWLNITGKGSFFLSFLFFSFFETRKLQWHVVHRYQTGMVCWLKIGYTCIYSRWISLRAGTELFRFTLVKIMVADHLAPCVARSSAAMILVMLGKSLSSTRKDFDYLYHVNIEISYN